MAKADEDALRAKCAYLDNAGFSQTGNQVRRVLAELERLRALLHDIAPQWMHDTGERDNEGNYLGPSKVYLDTGELRRLQAHFSSLARVLGEER